MFEEKPENVRDNIVQVIDRFFLFSFLSESSRDLDHDMKLFLIHYLRKSQKN